MLKIAKNDFGLDLKRSYFIGDTLRDVETARAAGCTSILVLSGKEKQKNSKEWYVRPDFVFKDLSEAAEFILKKNK